MDTPDAATGLTPRQKDAVRESWKKVTADWKIHGVEYFIRLFTTFPGTLKFFKSLDGLEVEQMRVSPKLRAHTINFKFGVTSFVDNLDDVEILIDLIHKTARNHFRRKIDPEKFKEAFALFTSYLQELKIDDVAVEAWEKTLGVVHTVICDFKKSMPSDEK